ncbi:MAG: alpha-ketoglutarate-dependent dioxygenase AlkB [Flavobacterium sp.]|nr:alpha-ketoglutarate-dependent dioxygenase AlkB [Flavobacterium sp.]
MERFQTLPVNILPCDGEALYYGRIFDEVESSELESRLLHDIEWKNDEVKIFGKLHITKRKIAWYGDQEYSYSYSNTSRNALPWTPDLLQLKSIIEKITQSTYNSCLLNLYHNGDEGVSWHSDNEKALGEEPAIASISLGADRKFVFKHKSTKETIPILLESGSLLLMKGKTQTNWLHSLPKSKKIDSMRINLTFRTFFPPNKL